MFNLQDFIPGESKWVDKLNDNFHKLDSDTGWISSPVVAPCTGEAYYRVINGKILLVRGSITPNQAIQEDLKITNLPANIISMKNDTPNGLWIVPVTGSAATDVAKIVFHPDYGLYFAGDIGNTGRPVIINIAIMD